MRNASNNRTAYTWRMPVYGGVFLLLMFAGGMSAWGQTVAFIDSFNGPADAFLLEDTRGNEKKIYNGTPLKTGYVITFRNSRARSVTLVLDSDRKQITHQNYPYKVQPLSNGEWCGSWCRTALNWLKSVSVNAHRSIVAIHKGPGEPCVEARSSFSIPLLKNAKLLPGKRSQLHVGWSDTTLSDASSKTLYTVEIYKNGSNEPVFKDNISFIHPSECDELRIREITLNSAGHEFKVGEHYQVEIATSYSDEKAKGTFQVVSEHEDPFLNAPEVRKQLFYIQAGWLANQGNGEWQFEAYQKVGGIPDYSAKMVRWGLSLGK